MITAGFPPSSAMRRTPGRLPGVAIVIVSTYLLYREKRVRAENSLKAQVSE